MIQKNFKKFGFIFLSLVVFSSCSSFTDMGGNTQSLDKLSSSPFISKLKGSTIKTLAINLGANAHISWMGFDFSGDYNYFQLTQYSINGVTVKPEDASSQSIYENISLTAPASTTSSNGQILLTFRYKPTEAIISQSNPHSADFIIVTDHGAPKTVRLQLNGYTQGICDPDIENCSSVSVTGLDVVEYTLSTNHDPDVDDINDFSLYLCGPIITSNNQDNDPDHEGTNLAYIPVKENLTFYVNSDETEVHFVRADTGGIEPTIPNFLIPVPPGSYSGVDIAAGTNLTANLEDEQDFSCPMENGVFTCEGLKLQIDMGTSIYDVVVVGDGLTLTNGRTTPPTDTDCSGFNEELVGSGTLSSDSPTMTMVGWGVVTDAQFVDSLKGSLVVVEIPLTRVSE